ncbi:MAG: endolytic transglycosylase MltG [Marinilabiliales bacterium]|nr:MAG: endolytic transglycosylase MltG [Marinilabiliales bacterium]
MKKIFWIVLIVLVVGGGVFAFTAYKQIFGAGIDLHGEEEWVLYLDNDATYEDFLDSLKTHNVLKYESTFLRLANYKDLNENMKPGRYVIVNGMSNNTLVNMMRSGNQSPVKITFNNIRTKEDFVEVVAPKMAFDAEELLAALNDDSIAAGYQLTTENIMVLFIPNTYEVYWNLTPKGFIDRMHEEYLKFWNEDRTSKAEAIGYSPVEISILASVVGAETNKVDEMPKIAGVYINRLHKGWKMEACPTVIYAMGDFTITRLLNRHLEYESDYNTYIHPGLPPGPINLPSPDCIDAVLNYEHHDYMFFSAKEDFSGYHNFARTNAEHEANARKYQAAYREWKRNQQD